jgi:soluble lytic murein transglycosylase-like protein
MLIKLVNVNKMNVNKMNVNKMNVNINYYIIGFLLAVQSCASGPRSISISLDPYTPIPVVDGGVDRDQKALTEYVTKNADDLQLVRDVTLIYQGMQANQSGDIKASVASWKQALEVARGRFGELAFIGWLRAYAKNLGTVMKRVDLARLVLSETKSGNISPWMVDRSLNSEDKISPILTREVSEFIEEEVAAETVKPNAPAISALSLQDPVLLLLAATVCKSKGQYGAGWDEWRAGLNVDVNLYFDGIVAQCRGQSAKALELLSDVAPRLASSTTLMPLALESYSRMIKMRRDLGERDSVAPLYLNLMKLWQEPSLKEERLGISRSEFERRRIDDTLWAVRARAVVGDGVTAKIFAEEVLGYLTSAMAQSYSLTAEQKNAFAGQMAETYHQLSFRIAVDARDWDEASRIVGIALEQPVVPVEWQNRLRWSQGVFRYLAGEYDQARRIWEALLTGTQDERLKPQLLFWLVQAQTKLGNTTEAFVFRKSLTVDYPLSFYTVVGLRQRVEEQHDSALSPFSDVNALRKILENWQQMDIEDLRMDPFRGPLVRRAEIFTSLGLVQFSGFAIDDLQKTLDVTTRDERQLQWALYVSRLYAASGNWLSAISLTTKLTKDPDFWKKKPEQILVYFPRPYLSTYKEIGTEQGVDPSILLGISRQESSFKADIKSGANAWGLMQLTPPTARRLLPYAGFSDPSAVKIPETLVRPEVNIRFGAAFVRELNARFLSNRGQVFAAYNAGPQAADSWIARRLVEDPLMFVELIPYSETRDYVKAVWRNENIYNLLEQK